MNRLLGKNSGTMRMAEKPIVSYELGGIDFVNFGTVDGFAAKV
ncbi:hypothetical protein SAMN05216490_4476 [Mucilaginibacter mallensis]|uniref:Uncharacterized protein n=1 Tax=Mucilaginibacter mallensis TaxID=652787 RepID=A0A1H2BZH7_MUCMA|nr:hypothetical protein [Mucilaginibacter mallensis]SDT63482.1 hypothetical protein SAMN05216490_4476 [Mucilaginibacter mallensis]